MLPQKIAFVDIETTGSRVNYDRIIEIGILRVEDNKVVEKYTTLLNPHMHLSPFIESTTGITTDQLHNAPPFDQVKEDILRLLEGCYFVAHNVRFDYGFLRNEFKRHELSYSSKHFCTVKLSRTLYPHFTHHNLDSIIERFGFLCERRHRAFDDASILWNFYQHVQTEFSQETLEKAFSVVLKRPSLPASISQDFLDGLPDSPGVYIFYGSQDKIQDLLVNNGNNKEVSTNKTLTTSQTNGTVPLYIGKSVNIRDRVLSHFSSDYHSTSEMNLCQQVESIETIETAGELGALFTESTLIKKVQPLFNRKLRYSKKLVVLKKITTKDGFDTVTIETVSMITVDEIETIMGVFRSKKQAKDFLISIAREHTLCERILPLEKTKGACFAYRLGWCKGACVSKEQSLTYNMRFILAFSSSKLKRWPFAGPIAIREENIFNGKQELHIIDKWCYLGSVKYDEFYPKSYKADEYLFDLDTYKIISSYLKSAKNTSQIQELSAQDLTTIISSQSSATVF